MLSKLNLLSVHFRTNVHSTLKSQKLAELRKFDGDTRSLDEIEKEIIKELSGKFGLD